MWRKLAIAEAIFLAAGALFSWWILNNSMTKPTWPAGIALLNFAIFGLILPILVALLALATLVHELGHYTAARIVGFKVESFYVLGLPLVRRKRPRPQVAGFLGWVGVETTIEQDRQGPWRLFVMAGPFASILLALICWFAFRFGSPLWQPLAFLEGALSISIVLDTLSFRKGRLPRTDLEKFLDVARPDSQVFANAAFQRLRPMTKAIDFDTFNSEDIARSRTAQDPSIRVATASIGCLYAIQKKSGTAEATAFYREACRFAKEAGGPYASSEAFTILCQDAALESSFCAAVFDRDLATSKSHLESLEALHAGIWCTARRVDVALTWLEGDIEAAHKSLETAKQILTGLNDPTLAEMVSLEWRLVGVLESTIQGSQSCS